MEAAGEQAACVLAQAFDADGRVNQLIWLMRKNGQLLAPIHNSCRWKTDGDSA